MQSLHTRGSCKAIYTPGGTRSVVSIADIIFTVLATGIITLSSKPSDLAAIQTVSISFFTAPSRCYVTFIITLVVTHISKVRVLTISETIASRSVAFISTTTIPTLFVTLIAPQPFFTVKLTGTIIFVACLVFVSNNTP